MLIHDVRPNTKLKKKKRIGRGGKRGTTAGRGTKGQKARAGYKIKPQIKEQILRLPKKRGVRFRAFKPRPQIVNLAIIAQKFENQEIVSPKTLCQKGIIDRVRGKLPKIKILANGTLDKKLIFIDCLFSRSALEKIKKAGGQIKKEEVLSETKSKN